MTNELLKKLIELTRGKYVIEASPMNGSTVCEIFSFDGINYDFPVGRIQKIKNVIRISYASHPAQISDADRFRAFCVEHDIPHEEYPSHRFVIENIIEHAERFNAIAKRLETIKVKGGKN